MSAIKVSLPLTREDSRKLAAGTPVLLSGTLYTMRDAAHKRLSEMLKRGEAPPIGLENICIYYTGPCPAAPGEIIGPCGPATSARMDAYTPELIERGVTAMIGKGARGEDVKQSMKEHGAVCFAVTGGVGILIAQYVASREVAAFEDLGPECILKLSIRELPALVAIDSNGGDMYDRGSK